MWSSKINLDKDKINVGVVSATYTDGNYSFTYSSRVRITQDEKETFLNEAKAALVKHQEKEARELALQSILDAELNTGE